MIRELEDAVMYEPEMTVKELWERIQENSQSISIEKVAKKWGVAIHPDTPKRVVNAYAQSKQIIENVRKNNYMASAAEADEAAYSQVKYFVADLREWFDFPQDDEIMPEFFSDRKKVLAQHVGYKRFTETLIQYLVNERREDVEE